jgi:hypothetical protein
MGLLLAHDDFAARDIWTTHAKRSTFQTIRVFTIHAFTHVQRTVAIIPHMEYTHLTKFLPQFL